MRLILSAAAREGKVIVHPGKVKVTRPYQSSTGPNIYTTLSICIEVGHELCVVCCDLSHLEQELTNEEERRTA